jgi:hypothetical protein
MTGYYLRRALRWSPKNGHKAVVNWILTGIFALIEDYRQ